MMVKVSAIVPVYNVEIYLSKCLDSILSQTLEDIEIIVVNDGSLDNSQKIIDDYYLLYPKKIISLKKKNGGLSDARNFGIKSAKGEYISFIDSDDYIDKDMFEKMYNKAVTTNSDIVSCPMTHVFQKKRRVKKNFYQKTESFGKSVIKEPELLNLASPNACNKIFRREFWEKFNFKFPVGKYFEDSAIIYNVLLKSNKIEYVNIPFYYYIKERDDSICSTVDEKIFDIFESCDSIIDFYKENDAYNKIEASIVNICFKHLCFRLMSLRYCNNNNVIKIFIDRFYNYLEKLPGWSDAKYFKDLIHTRSSKHEILRLMIKNKTLLKIFFTCLSSKHQHSIGKRLPNIRKNIKLYNKTHLLTSKKINKKKENNQKYGLEVLAELKIILDKFNITNFCDFGTLLGLIREKKILNHDLDLDYGIIDDGDLNKNDINFYLERAGFRLWREYIYNDELTQFSYFYKKIKIDINFYKRFNNSITTLLYYKKPEEKIKNNELNVVEMKYTDIIKTKSFGTPKYSINIPEKPEIFLKEKYGDNWKIPDKNWIYWQSPAGKLLNKTGYFIEYKFNLDDDPSKSIFL